MRKINYDFKELSVLINTLRERYANQIFTRSEMYNLLKGYGFPKDYKYIIVLINLGILVCTDKNGVLFPEEPIHVNKIQKSIDELRMLYVNEKKKTENKVKNDATVDETKIEINQQNVIKLSDIESAIKLLKSVGYRIYKEV